MPRSNGEALTFNPWLTWRQCWHLTLLHYCAVGSLYFAWN